MFTKSKALGNRTHIPRSAAYSLVTILIAPVRFHILMDLETPSRI